MLRCERCGATARYSPDHLEEMKLRYSAEENDALVDAYWRDGIVRCPRDGVVLNVFERRIISPRPKSVRGWCPFCGRGFSSRDAAGRKPPPDSFEASYSEMGLLGEGGMGRTSLVRHRGTDEVVAAKRIAPSLLGSAEAVKRFQREKRILARLNHPHIVPVREVFLDENGGVLVMQYMTAGDLSLAINEPSVSSLTLVSYLRQVSGALSYLHSEGVIHRDLKPANVLIGGTGAHISDFGLAVLLQRDSTPLTRLGQRLGTPAYMAPEQREGSGNVTAACDIYAFALIAYETLTRRSPYAGALILDEFSGPLRTALLSALSQDPAARPDSGSEIVEAVLEEVSR